MRYVVAYLFYYLDNVLCKFQDGRCEEGASRIGQTATLGQRASQDQEGKAEGQTRREGAAPFERHGRRPFMSSAETAVARWLPGLRTARAVVREPGHYRRGNSHPCSVPSLPLYVSQESR